MVRTLLVLVGAFWPVGMPAMSAEPQRPVHLEMTSEEDFVELRVVGDPSLASPAAFTLEVLSRGEGGTTNTTQSGTASRAGAGGTLLRSRIQISKLASWSARLRVRIGETEYVEIMEGPRRGV